MRRQLRHGARMDWSTRWRTTLWKARSHLQFFLVGEPSADSLAFRLAAMKELGQQAGVWAATRFCRDEITSEAEARAMVHPARFHPPQPSNVLIQWDTRHIDARLPVCSIKIDDGEIISGEREFQQLLQRYGIPFPPRASAYVPLAAAYEEAWNSALEAVLWPKAEALANVRDAS
jgi:hypothetical protein